MRYCYILIFQIFALTFLSSQNKVGININFPIVELDVRSNLPEDGSDINIGNSTNSHYLRLFSGKEASINSNPTIYWKFKDSLLFGHFGESFTEIARFTPDGHFLLNKGKVGIGKKSPLTEIHVLGSTGNSRLTLESSSTGLASLLFTDGSGSLPDSHWSIVRESNDKNLKIRHNNIDRMIMIPEGWLGLGVPTPLTELHVADKDGWSFITNESQLNGDAIIQLTDNAGAGPFNHWTIRREGDSGNFQIHHNDDSNRLFSINTFGSVAIGPHSPATKLDVEGTIRSSSLVGDRNRPVLATPTGDLIVNNDTIPRYWSTTGSSFVSEDPGFRAGLQAYVDFSSSNTPMYSAVYLPDGAQIISFKADFVDSSNSSNIKISLCRATQRLSGIRTLAEVVSSGIPGFDDLFTSTINNGIVNNGGYVYYIKVEPDAGNWDGFSLVINAVEIGYILP